MTPLEELQAAHKAECLRAIDKAILFDFVASGAMLNELAVVVYMHFENWRVM